MKHESIAKAEVKGAFRQVKANFEQLKLNKKRGLYTPFSKKNITRFINDISRLHQGFLLYNRRTMRKNSWHFYEEMAAVEYELIEMDGIGPVSRLFIDGWDTRRLIKGGVGHLSYKSKFYFHEHFLIRMVQRLGLHGFTEIGPKIYPLITWIVNRNRPSKWYACDSHFVFKEYVIVAASLHENKGLVFKTVLLTEFFNERQKAFYQVAVDCILRGKCDAVYLDAEKCISKEIKFSDELEIFELAGSTFWINPA
ncbi:hypothetical protein [Shewanella colwelliana]|uniref:hypothetical protein n=1 Tax=Shewanella colwelliana TaxID=23 RepID=UPI00048F89F9|nr:hypothetical protein [Shewanella colwelliana]